MYLPYLSVEEFKNINPDTVVPEKDQLRYLKQASRHVDTLTFNRIVNIDALTEFRKETVKEVVGLLAEFEYENREVLQSVLSSYSINGVSMNFGESWNIKIINGIAVPADLYDTLAQTGLCARTFYY